eukprot:617077-Rhodomonas_salina.1
MPVILAQNLKRKYIAPAGSGAHIFVLLINISMIIAGFLIAYYSGGAFASSICIHAPLHAHHLHACNLCASAFCFCRCIWVDLASFSRRSWMGPAFVFFWASMSPKDSPVLLTELFEGSRTVGKGEVVPGAADRQLQAVLCHAPPGHQLPDKGTFRNCCRFLSTLPPMNRAGGDFVRSVCSPQHTQED